MTTSLERYTDRHPHAVDVIVMLALMGCAALGVSLITPGIDRPDNTLPGELPAGISCIALLAARSHPRTAVVVTTAGAASLSILGYLLTPLLLAPTMGALYWLAALTDSKTTRVYGVTTIVALVGLAVIYDPSGDVVLLKTVGPFCWLLLPLVGGSQARFRRAYLASVQARAEHAEQTREEEARLRVAEERIRIARELHDVVAHHLALANAQAATASYMARTGPEQMQKILTDLNGTTASALRELKTTVGLLRQADDPEQQSLDPAPGLARLPELVSACQAAGRDVTVTTHGKPQPLSPVVDLTAYRILQEALTNVTKHAAVQAADVRLDYSGTRLAITVTNNGPVPADPDPDPGRGFGLIGMRERAHSVGGDLRVGPRREGGFEVAAALPLQPRALQEGDQ
ncbi:sensor histidine kinase [Spirillospora sp. CA-142024]|uniref:sensor histidine kinase n=1 Tax=Spirillospora sp. CA-142024 TaxID=3240036 RepID=UPI003D89DECA